MQKSDRSRSRHAFSGALGWAAALGLAALVLQVPARGQQPGPAAQAQAQAQRQGETPAQQPEQPPQPVFRTGINFVRVDVIVTDGKGNPITDLKPEDFEVFEDGKPQKIESFKLLQLTGAVPPGETPRAIRSDYDQESEAQREDVRIFVILLDDYHVRLGSSMGVRQPLTNFIRNQLGPLDLLGVMYPLTPVSGMRLTRDHESIIRVIEKFEGRKFDYRPRNEFEEKYSQYPTEIVERVRNQVSLSALEGLAVALGGIREGRKAVILVSEGYSNYVPPQMRDPVAEMPGFGNPNARRPMVGDGDFNEERYQFFNNLDLQTEMREVYAAANRANTAIYALDPRGLAPFEYGINEGVGMRIDQSVLNSTMDTLRVLADETDGRAIVNRNDLESGLKQIVRDTGSYYLVGYNSTQAPSDGKFHEIKVRVKRSGAQVRARKGYWALTAEETARAIAPPRPGPDPAVTKALAAVEAPARARLARTWLGMGVAGDGKTRVELVWEPVPPVPGSERRSAPARLSLIAAGGDGPAYFRGKVPSEPAAASAAKGGRVTFDAVPGPLQLRLAFEDAEGRVIDSDLMDVEVADYTVPEVALSSLAVFAVRSARDLQALNADPEAVPSAAREFRRTDRLIVRFHATGPGEVAPTVTARLLNRAGAQMAPLPVQKMPGDAPSAPSQVDLPLSGLPPGEYLIEVSAAAAGNETKQLLGFRVIS